MYKVHGLRQFLKLYNLHKEKEIKEEDLHWGEEIEYHLYVFDEETKKVRLACDADEIIQKFGEYSELLENFKDVGSVTDQDTNLFSFEEGEKPKMEEPTFKLLPEFGNFMIEAVPLDPYGAYQQPEQLLKCQASIESR